MIAGCVGLAIVAAGPAARVADRLDVQGGSLHETEATRVAAMLETRFARDAGETFLVLVSGPAPLDRGLARERLERLAAALRREPYVHDVTAFSSPADSSLLSADRRTTLVLVTLRVSDPDSLLALVPVLRVALCRALAAFPEGAAYRAIVTGDTPLERDMLTVTTRDVARSERWLLPLAGAMLILAFGSLVAAVLPLVIGFLGIAVALAAIGALAAAMPMSIYVLHTATMIGLGVGIDYSLLVVTRFREEVERGLAPEEAVARTLATAGRTVATSGLCVVVGFAALLFTPLIETRSIGVGGSLVVVAAVVLSLTLLPALLAVLGPRVGRRRRPGLGVGGNGMWERWARSVSRHPGRALLGGGALMLALTAPLVQIRIGLPARHWWPAATEAGAGLEALTRLGGAGYAQPIRVLVQWPAGRSAVAPGALRALRVLSDSLRVDPRVREIRSLVNLRPTTSLLEYALLYSDLAAVRARAPALLETFLSGDARATRLDVILADTTSLLSAMDVVRRARRLATTPPLMGARVLVGGYVAQNVDFQDDLLRRLPVLIASILGAMALMLGLVFRSVLIPLKAICLNTLSVSATFGLIVLVFQRGMGTEALFVAVPILVFAVVFGLSMDYEVFLLARIKEAFDSRRDAEQATIEGLAASAAVISWAALLMVTVFGVFAFARVLVVQLLGFGLAVAVLLDATIVRLVLTPAVVRLAGAWNWWPGVRGARSP